MPHTPYRYSPLEISEYRITSLDLCEVSAIMKLKKEHSTAVWNLFWLSVSDLDVLPVAGKTPNWYKQYAPTPGALRAVTADAIDVDEALSLKLLLHPTRFISFFERQNHGTYDCYEALGGGKWVETVLKRAAMSAKNMASNLSADIRNNVYAFPVR